MEDKEAVRTMKIMEKHNMENNEKHVTDTDPKINYKGWKAMPFIIGKESQPCTSYMLSSSFLWHVCVFSVLSLNN